METHKNGRTLRWLVPGLALLLLVGAGCAQNGGMTENPSAPGSAGEYAAPTPPEQMGAGTTVSGAKQLAFREAMDRLWEDHVTWTRLYIVSAANGLKDTDAVAARLMKNQEAIGNAFGAYAGSGTGTQLTALLKVHIDGATRVLAAAKSGDQAKLNSSLADWRKNGDDIAALLSAVDPADWPLAAMQAGMKKHLDTTLAEAGDYLAGKYDLSAQDYDTVKDHIYMMSGMLADGIIKQFPDKF